MTAPNHCGLEMLHVGHITAHAGELMIDSTIWVCPACKVRVGRPERWYRRGGVPVPGVNRLAPHLRRNGRR